MGLGVTFYNLNANAAVYGVDAPANSAFTIQKMLMVDLFRML